MIPLIFSTDMQQVLSEMLLSMVGMLPKLILVFIILLGGTIIANMMSKLIKKALDRFNLNKYTDKLNEIDFFYKNNIQVRLSSIAAKIVKYIILLVFIMTAVGVLDMPVLAQLIQDIIKWIPNLIASFIILIGGLLIGISLQNVVTSTCKSLGIPSASMIGSFVFYFIFLNVLIVALSQAQINTTFFAQNISIIIAGIVLAFSIGYGFASKDLVASFLASYYTKSKLNIGDRVKLNEVEGIITEVDKSSVRLRTEDKDIIIPLNKVLLNNIEIYRN
jgi:hypothetical protein